MHTTPTLRLFLQAMTPRCLSLLVFSSLLIHVSGDQRVLSAEETRNGYLRRFNIESSVPWVLDTAKVCYSYLSGFFTSQSSLGARSRRMACFEIFRRCLFAS